RCVKLFIKKFQIPSVRQNARYSQLTPFESRRTVGMQEAGLRAWRNCRNESLENRRRGSGRPRITNNREERHLRLLALRDPFDTSRSVGTHWVGVIDRRVSLYGTVIRRIHSFGLSAFRPILELPLAPSHRAAKLATFEVILAAYSNKITPDRMTRRYLEEQNIDVLPWSSRSLNLSLIEHLWDKMGQKLQHSPDNLEQFREELQIA
ncbi:hypothetical protein BDFB_010287, partial [Asbolus verrucosus]